MDEQNSRVGPNFFLGLMIVAIGALLLLDRLGYIESVNIFDFWPLIFVAVGLSRLLQSRSGGAQLIGAVATIAGLVLLAHNLGYVRLNWSVLWPVCLILFGISILIRSLSRPRGNDDPMSSPSALNDWVMFGGSKVVNTSADFRGGDVLALFGGYQLILTKADIAQEAAVLDVTAVFGGVEVKVPQDWLVINKITPVFGGVDDKTSHPASGVAQKRLVLRGCAVFGGVEIKN
jgi:predicted membrane protein